MSEARSQRRRGKKMPTPEAWSKGHLGSKAAVCDPPKRFGCRETSDPPVKSRGAQTPRGAHAAKAAVASRECARCGCTQFVRVAEVDRTRRVSFPS